MLRLSGGEQLVSADGVGHARCKAVGIIRGCDKRIANGGRAEASGQDDDDVQRLV